MHTDIKSVFICVHLWLKIAKVILITKINGLCHKKTALILNRNGLSFVRKKGLEPPRREAPDPKSGAATNYATSAVRMF